MAPHDEILSVADHDARIWRAAAELLAVAAASPRRWRRVAEEFNITQDAFGICPSFHPIYQTIIEAGGPVGPPSDRFQIVERIIQRLRAIGHYADADQRRCVNGSMWSASSLTALIGRVEFDDEMAREKTRLLLSLIAGEVPPLKIEPSPTDVIWRAPDAEPFDNLDLENRPVRPTKDRTTTSRAVASGWNDVANAARFVRQWGKSVRFCYPWGKWLIWTGKLWRVDDGRSAMKLAKRTALSIYEEAAAEGDNCKRAGVVKHAMATLKRDRLNAMIELAKCELAITPEKLDTQSMLLNCQNGTVDLGTGELKQHSRKNYITKICRAAYRPAAASPHFKLFLDRIFRTHPTLIDYVQKSLGYACTGDVREQSLFFLLGDGANGKTTLLDVVMFSLGDYASKADRELLAASDNPAHPTDVADLMGKRLVVCSETNEGRRFDEAKLKDLVGETVLKARFMRKDFFEFTATHKIFLYSNHELMVRGTDQGFWRRMRIIPFIEVITDDERDAGLRIKLQAEADGVLAWLVRGCRAWQAEGLGIPDEVKQATDSYRNEMDSIGTFLAERCTGGDRLKTSAKDLYAAYTQFSELLGEKPRSQKRLGTTLAERGFKSARCSYLNTAIWLGIGLEPELAGDPCSQDQ